MSIGCFLGIGAASHDAALVEQWRTAVRDALSAAGQPAYVEADGLAAEQRSRELAGQARSSLDSLGSGSLQAMGRMVVRARRDAAGPFRDFAMFTTDLTFVPGDFTERLAADGVPGRCLWSTSALIAALRQTAMTLGLPMVNGAVPDDVVKRIVKFKKLSKGDPATNVSDDAGFNMLEHYRPAWLTLWEFARLAHEHRLALALRG